MRKPLFLALLPLLIVGVIGAADPQQYVNWLEPLGYSKPRFYLVTEPDEASAANKYYLNLSSGSGSACTQGAPCSNFSSLAGKAGMSGGPAYVYVKGNGYLNLTSGTFAGSVGNEIVVKPWPGDSTPTVWTAQSGCTRPAANTVSASGVHDIIFDGGPDMLLRFKGSGCQTDQNGYTLVVASNNITIWRVRMDGAASSGPILGPAVGSGTNQQGFRLINSELYNSKYYGVYGGGGTSCGAGDTQFQNMEFRKNIIRDVEGRGIQVEPRAASDGLIIDGNVLHNYGYDRSGFNGGPSAAFQAAGSCSGATSHITITNNVAFDGGGGLNRVDYSGSPTCADYLIANNTLYDYGKSSATANKNSHGIGVDTAGYCATIKNNILVGLASSAASQGVAAIDPTRGGSLVTAKNLCDSGGGNCGSTAITATAANTFASTSTSSLSFLSLKSGSTAINGGATVALPTSDFLNKSRSIGSAIDVGAFEFGTGGNTAPATPGNPH